MYIVVWLLVRIKYYKGVPDKMVKEKKFEILENSQAALTLTIDAESIEKAYSEKIEKYAKTIDMPGFRKGHAPLSVVERKIGVEVRNEVTFDKMEENLKEAIESLEKAQKPLSYATPELQDEENLLPFKKDSDVTFTVKYDINPVFELPQYKGLEVEYEDKGVTDEDVEREIEKLREQGAIIVNKTTPAENGDIATINYTVSVDGLVEEDYTRNDFSFTLGTSYNTFKLDDDVVGMSTGEEKTVEKTYTDEDAPNDDLKGKTVEIKIALLKLKKRELPEVDDDFAQDVKDEYKNVDDLKCGIRKDLEEKLEEYRKNAKASAAIEAIVSKVDFAVPQSMVDQINENKWDNFASQFGGEKNILDILRRTNDTKEHFISSWIEESKKDAKREVVLSAIVDKENFQASDEEIEEFAGEEFKNLDGKTKETYKGYLAEEVKFQKIVPFLIENNTFKAVEKKADDKE